MSFLDFPTLVERALSFLSFRAKPLGLACVLAAASLAPLGGESFEKGPIYSYDRYGSQKSSKAVVGYKIYTPFKNIHVPIEQPCLIRRYDKDGVRTDVLFSDPGLEAIWV